ncbi:DUF6382 domain-containing protein [Blautia sp. MSJ-19]|uniref:DUF6382 domain-containing protein n=1 Tax=Blautia sp. MSJ-19 TaxID=2841517 RepID=UPI001C0EF503|nr:DUF6382 domain-containing protein [Blautia sp. MSJ-19]MBU5482449.1 FHA domain-containing protein [Blautia sp. MSJ-19]
MYAEYKRDVSHNYLILHGESDINTASYQVRMLTGNSIPSVLKCRIQGLDGKQLFYYDITSRQSVASFYEQKKLKGGDLAMLLRGFLQIMEELAEYLVDPGQLVLCPEYMFLDVEARKVYFCCLPGYQHPVQEQFRQLTEYFLPKLDHEDPEAVDLGYGIYRRAMEPGLQLEHIKEAVYKTQNNREKEQEVKNEEKGLVAECTDTAEKKPDPERPAEEIQLENKKENIWKWAAGCAGGVLFLLGIVAAGYLGYIPGIPVELVIAAAIVLLAAGAVCMRIAEKKKRKKAQTAEWRKKVQRELEKDQRMPTVTDVPQQDLKPTDNFVCEEKPPEILLSKNVEKIIKEKIQTEKVQTETENRFQDDDGRYGETVVLSAAQMRGSASLVSREPGELAPIYLEKELTVIGKLENASDAVIPLPTISRIHARIRKCEEEYYLMDLNSRNGTSVNGRMLKPEEEYQLQDEDQVDFAQARYIFLR